MKVKIPKLNPFKFRNHRLIPNFDSSLNIPASLSMSAVNKLVKDRHCVASNESSKGLKVRLNQSSITFNKSEYPGPLTTNKFPTAQFTLDGDLLNVREQVPNLSFIVIMSTDLPAGDSIEELQSWMSDSDQKVALTSDYLKGPIDDYVVDLNVNEVYGKNVDSAPGKFYSSWNQYYLVVVAFYASNESMSSDDILFSWSSCSINQVGSTWNVVGSKFGNYWVASNLNANGVVFQTVWTDGINTYGFDTNGNSLLINPVTLEVTNVDWGIQVSIVGDYVFTDGSDIYTVSGNTMYKLNSSKTGWDIIPNWHWEGDDDDYAHQDRIPYLWMDFDGDIYCSRSGEVTYKLDKSTFTFNIIEFNLNGLDLSGKKVWTDGTNIYAGTASPNDSSPYNYVFNKADMEWTSVDLFNGNPQLDQPINGEGVWTDGTNIYAINYPSSGVSDVYLKFDSDAFSVSPFTGSPYPSDIFSIGCNSSCSLRCRTFTLLNSPDPTNQNHTIMSGGGHFKLAKVSE
jgi:hypothetical protein